MNTKKEDFKREVLHFLSRQQQRYPAMEQQDTVKFIFQAMLGVGHLLSARPTVEDAVAREMNRLAADGSEPLYEMISPSWCRLHLRPAKARGITPSAIAGMMLSAGDTAQFTREETAGFCEECTAFVDQPVPDPDLLNRIRDTDWIPSHSDTYREKYRPAYRVIAAEWIPYLGVVQGISAREAAAERLMVTIDGPCASGKTTLAGKLAWVFSAAVVHTDDYVIPHAQKTPERLAVPGGNCDADRLAREVTVPWKRGEPVTTRRYDFRNDRLLPEEKLPECRILILEGSYCNLPVIRECADIRVFLDTPREIRWERLRKRESPQSLQMFRDRWIPLEDHYFQAYNLPDRGTVIAAPYGEQA